MPTFRTAFVTHGGLPRVTADDEHLAAALRGRQCTVDVAIWDDRSVRWRDFDGVVLRSCWDYHRRPVEFLAWLAARETDGTRLWNPPRTVRWNSHKGYLLELAAAGVPVVESTIIRRGSHADLSRVLRVHGWRRAVVKPAVSASAWRTFAVSRDEAGARQEDFHVILADGDALVQPYLEAIERDGEWSLMFVAGTFSHAVLKRPREGEFRVQSELGGQDELTEPPLFVRKGAERALVTAGKPWLYARVDGLALDGQFVLMELELIEPVLFFEQCPDAAARLADGIVAATSPH